MVESNRRQRRTFWSNNFLYILLDIPWVSLKNLDYSFIHLIILSFFLRIQHRSCGKIIDRVEKLTNSRVDFTLIFWFSLINSDCSGRNVKNAIQESTKYLWKKTFPFRIYNGHFCMARINEINGGDFSENILDVRRGTTRSTNAMWRQFTHRAPKDLHGLTKWRSPVCK